tara:strand:+ start:1955 stop:3904 length:1950 start_codon:yes stop_codon:yes gene_type:complete
MSCRWIIDSKGDIEGAYKTKTDERSKLFDELDEEFGKDKAIEFFAVSESTVFQDIFGKVEPKKEVLIRYVVNQNQSIEELSVENIVELQDFENFNKQKLIDTFYDKNGLFIVNKNKLVKSGLYSTYEANLIEEDINLQKTIKESLERLKNTDVDISVLEVEVERQKTGEVSSFGKLKKTNPYIEEKEMIENSIDMSEQEFENAYPGKEKPKGYKKAEVFVDDNGEVKQKRKTETETLIPLVTKSNPMVRMMQNIQGLLSLNLTVLQNNTEDTLNLLQEIEKDLISEGIDVIGLENKNINEELFKFLEDLNTFLINPSEANTRMFADSSDSFFNRDLSPLEEVIKGDENKEYVVLETTLSEEEVYEQQGLIKLEGDKWIKTAKEDLETLYNNLKTYTEKIPEGKTLEEHIQSVIGEFHYNNAETAEAVALYKMYFEVENTTEEKKVLKNTANFTGSYNRLTNGFIADFYADYLKEKRKESKLFRDFYSNFEFNEKGIKLKNTDDLSMRNVQLYASEDLKQYSIISKQMPSIAGTSTGQQSPRDNAINNPDTVENFKGDLFKLNDNEYIVKNTVEDFVKISNNIYESVGKQGNLNHYVQLEKNESEYLKVGTERPKTSLNLNDYNYLENKPESFTKVKNYLKGEIPGELSC